MRVVLCQHHDTGLYFLQERRRLPLQAVLASLRFYCEHPEEPLGHSPDQLLVGTTQERYSPADHAPGSHPLALMIDSRPDCTAVMTRGSFGSSFITFIGVKSSNTPRSFPRAM